MDWPYHFPHPADVIAEDAERFRAAPPRERVRRLAEICELARKMVAASPNRAAIDAFVEGEEAKWRAAHQKIFERYESL